MAHNNLSRSFIRFIRSGVAAEQRRSPKEGSTLTAEAYRVKYLVGGNARHSRLLRYARMRRREAREQ